MSIKAFGNNTEDFVNKFLRARGGDSTGLDAVSPRPPQPAGITATGGTIVEYEVSSVLYRAHIFTETSTFNITALSSDTGTYPNNVDFLLIGGGGAGGADYGGGGGGGGFVEATDQAAYTSTGPYSVVIGAGGARVPDSAPVNNPGTNSTIAVSPGYHSPGTVVATGGGGGGCEAPPGSRTGQAGGSGGGACYGQPGGSANQPAQNPALAPDANFNQYGENGGAGASPNPVYTTGGGGGSNAQGVAGDTTDSGGGGNARASFFAYGPSVPIAYAGGGGGGGAYDNSNPGGRGGTGGGGRGGGFNRGNSETGSSQGANAVRSTGSGGGGGGSHGSNVITSGSGGSGFAVIRYRITPSQPSTYTVKATGGAVSFSGGKTIHAFMESGTFTIPGTFSETVEYIAIGGGGAGGGDIAGGGGAGAWFESTSFPLSGPAAISIGIGAGGANNTTNPATSATYNPGSSTTISAPFSVTAPGGGSGGLPAAPLENGQPGGSGGGGRSNRGSSGGTGSGDPFPGTPGTSPSNGWGNDGAGGLSSAPAGGGGGAGGAAVGRSGINGGAGILLPATFQNPASIYGYPGPTSGPNPGIHWLAGGGGGSGWPGNDGGHGGNSPENANPYAGAGRGCSDAPVTIVTEINPFGGADNEVGQRNSGSGGGGGGNSAPTTGGSGGGGGSGIVLIAYPT